MMILIPHIVMSIYSNKLAHVQVVINFQYSVAQLRTHEDTLTHILGAVCILMTS